MLTKHLESFSWPTEFACTIITEKLILPNHYSIRIGIEPNDPKTTDVNLGFKKIKYFISNYINNAVIVNQENQLANLTTGIDTNFILLPCEPYDYFFATILYNKLSSIAEKYFDIGYLGLDSSIGDRVEYTIMQINDSELDLKGKYWWNEDSVNTGTDDHPTWEELDFRDRPKFCPKIVQGGLSEG